MNANKWKRFWFEGNRWFGWIGDKEDWQRLRDAYDDKTDEQLLAAKKCDDASVPNFGFRREHTGAETLADFFSKHGMTPPPNP